MLTETVYLDRDNTIDLLLKADGVAVDLSSVNRMVLEDVDAAWDVDSSEVGTAFDWDQETTGKVVIAIGDQAIDAGTYTCRLVVYDPTNDAGIVWDTFILQVEA